MSTVTIACKIPNGLILESADRKTKVTLAGPNGRPCTAEFIDASRSATTQVNSALWTEWYAAHADLPMVKNGIVAEVS